MRTFIIKYARTGKSSTTDNMGMREMQAMVYRQRNRRHLLVKAPPVSGKSRAMMFVASTSWRTKAYGKPSWLCPKNPSPARSTTPT